MTNKFRAGFDALTGRMNRKYYFLKIPVGQDLKVQAKAGIRSRMPAYKKFTAELSQKRQSFQGRFAQPPIPHAFFILSPCDYRYRNRHACAVLGGAIESGATFENAPPAEAIPKGIPNGFFSRRKLFCPAKFRLSVRQFHLVRL
ncbi:MAG TPA: hypothetical protein VGM68_08645 [Rhizomicrobium sp.]